MDAPQKAHRAPRAGNKAEKRKKDKKHSKGFNEKAFAPQSGINADRRARRKAEKDQTKLHVPLVDRTPEDDPPPIIIAVVGPPGVGKTTLVKSLVRRYTKHTLSEPKGPVTVVSGKRRRLTFIECNNDLNSMIDTGKVADLVLLMVDASLGFEMETFEFLNILQAHGFPKVMGILTHLDLIKHLPAQRETKKRLKKRFWTEIYQGAKLFYLSGILNGRYPDQEIHNLSRFISIMKFRPLVFRNTHSYLLADRIEDLTPREAVRNDPKVNRTITLYGYLRGTNLKPSTRVHVPGAGDLSIKSIAKLGDPCPLPTVDSERRRKLSEKHKLIHAPMSDVGAVMYDKDAVYINVPGNFSRRQGEDGVHENDEPLGEGEKMVIDLQDVRSTLADNISKSNIVLLPSSAAPLKVHDDEAEEVGDDDNDGSSLASDEGDEEGSEDFDSDEDEAPDGQEENEENLAVSSNQQGVRGGRTSLRTSRVLPSSSSHRTKKGDNLDFAESDSDIGDEPSDDGNEPVWRQTGEERIELDGDEDEDIESDTNVDYDGVEDLKADRDNEDGARWKHNLAALATANYHGKRRRDLVKLIYHSELTPEQIAAGETVASAKAAATSGALVRKDDEFFSIRKPAQLLDNASSSLPSDQTKEGGVVLTSAEDWDDEVLDTFRDLFITGDASENRNDGGTDEEGDGFEDLEETAAVEKVTELQEEAQARALVAKKEDLKRKFDEQYDDSDEDGEKIGFYEEKKAEMAQQLKLNRQEFEGVDEGTRVLVEGYRAGMYLRVELADVPCELVQNFDPAYPIIIGGLLPAEERLGFVQVRIKRHRWFTRTLKTNDPLIFSLGWRRFQTLPIYSLDDHSIRMRMLKYTPEHMHCYATFYGPVSLPNTGFCAFNSVTNETPAFRVSATGLVLDIDRSVKIVKKLKLTGFPYKTFKNTAFIKDMFSSPLEVAKFEGAMIRTVSGIRGQIKKSLAKPEGAFRATFEDKILMSDIIFLRGWYSIQPRKYYNPVTSLLSRERQWAGMRLTGQVRKEQGIKTPLQRDSAYKRIERVPPNFKPLRIPRQLQAALPYAVKSKVTKPQPEKRAVIMEPEEKRAIELLQQIRAVNKDKVARQKAKRRGRREEYKKKKTEVDELKAQKKGEEKKEAMRLLGQKQKRAEIGGGGSRKKRKM